MSKEERRKDFEWSLGLANTVLVSAIVGLGLGLVSPLLGFVGSYIWVNHRMEKERKLWKKLLIALVFGFLGIIIAPLLYLIAVYSAVMYYLE